MNIRIYNTMLGVIDGYATGKTIHLTKNMKYQHSEYIKLMKTDSKMWKLWLGTLQKPNAHYRRVIPVNLSITQQVQYDSLVSATGDQSYCDLALWVAKPGITNLVDIKYINLLY